MITIREKKLINLSIFEISKIYNDKLYEKRIVNFLVKNYKKIWVIYDEDMRVIPEVYSYINTVKVYRSENTLAAATYSIKYIYSFCSIFCYDIWNLTFTQLGQLNSFLTGYCQTGEMDIRFITKRSKETVRTIFETYKDYCDYSGKLEQKNRIESFLESLYPSVKKYHVQRDYTGNTKSVPSFINPYEFKNIINCIRSSSDTENIKIRNELIVRIGYQSGRLGEILGSTLEDFNFEDSIGSNGKLRRDYFIITRNRLSDRRDQFSKGNTKVRYIHDYEDEKYTTEDVGYSKIYITEEIYQLFEKYVDNEHTYQSKKHKDRYTSTKADAVGSYKRMKYTNHYVFLNRYGSRLSASDFNKELRKIFISTGLDVDISKRKNNLFHRFRHGFAMFYIFSKNGNKPYNPSGKNNFSETDKEYLRILMRHKCSESLDYYFHPTDTQIHEYKELMEKGMYVGDIIKIEEKI